MSILSRLFGKPDNISAEATNSEDYNGYRITPASQKEGSVWRLAARIERASDGKVHELIRADTLQSKDEADAAALAKAKQVIDEQGDGLFR